MTRLLRAFSIDRFEGIPPAGGEHPNTLDRLTELAMPTSRSSSGISSDALAILTSGRFLFRTELRPQPDDPMHRHRSSEYALASRLSYLLWLSLPDEQVDATRPAAGELRNNLPLSSSGCWPIASQAFLEDFAGRVAPHPQHSDDRDLQARHRRPSALGDEAQSDMLFERIVRNDRDLLELVTADYTFINEQLAKYYGIQKE